MKDIRPIDYKIHGVRLTPDDVKLLIKRGERPIYAKVNFSVMSEKRTSRDANRCLSYWNNHFHMPLTEFDVAAVEAGKIYTISQFDYDRLMDYKRSLDEQL